MAEVTRDKTTWGQGEWLSEPDHKEWRDEATGLPCIAHRQMQLGHWCGYVAIPPGHPLHGKDYDNVDIEGHGGINYASKCEGGICHVAAPGEPDDVWWFGFDCAHSGDLCPAMAARDEFRGWARDGMDTYKPLTFIESQCASLAKQLAALSSPSGA